MEKSQIEQIKMLVYLSGTSVLSISLHKNGEIGRQGTGNIPVSNVSVVGMSDGSEFKKLIAILNEDILENNGIYEHQDKSGLPLDYQIVFLGEEPLIKVFEFILGTETKEVSHLLPYFGFFINEAIKLTDEMYSNAIV